MASAEANPRQRRPVNCANQGRRDAAQDDVLDGHAFGPIAPSVAQIKASLLAQITPNGKAAKIAALLQKHGYLLSFAAFSAGRLVIDWYYLPAAADLARATPQLVLIAAGNATFTRARTVMIKIKLTASGKRLLKHSKRLKLTAKSTLTPTANPPVVATRTFTLTR